MQFVRCLRLQEGGRLGAVFAMSDHDEVEAVEDETVEQEEAPEEDEDVWEGCHLRNDLEKECHPHCTRDWDQYQACAQRIKGKENLNCTPQYFVYYHCVDHCVRFAAFAFCGVCWWER